MSRATLTLCLPCRLIAFIATLLFISSSYSFGLYTFKASMARERTIRVNMNGELAEEWERDPFEDDLLASPETLYFEYESIQDSIHERTPLAERFQSLRGSYSSPPPAPRADRRPIREWSQSPITPPAPNHTPINEEAVYDLNAVPEHIRVMMTSHPSQRVNRRLSFDREVVYEAYDDHMGHPVFVICDYTLITKPIDRDFKRKYEENGGDEFYCAPVSKRIRDADFWRECADELIEPYSDSE